MNISARPRHKNASVAVTTASFRVRGGTIAHFHLSPAAAAKAGIKGGTRLAVRLVNVAGPNGATKPGVEIAFDKSGVKASKRRHGLLIQKSGLFPVAFRSTAAFICELTKGRLVIVPLFPANDNALTNVAVEEKPVCFTKGARRLPEFLTSLSMDPGWKRRRDMLAGTARNVRTTPAGDQCYTAIYIPRLALKAAGRSKFDIDVCSMKTDGRYDIGLPAITQRTWGSTPERFRNDEHVIRHVPAKRHFTNDQPYGSLARVWDGELIWLNPPYSLRAWATFLEYAHLQVAEGHAGIIVALVPRDDMGPHNRHFYGEHAYRIEIMRDIPFYKREKRNKNNKVTARHVIDVIQGTQFVVFGKGAKVKRFLERFLEELRDIDYISDQHLARYTTLFGLRHRTRRKRKLAA